MIDLFVGTLVGFLIGAVGIGGLIFSYFKCREDLTQYQVIHDAIDKAINERDRFVTIYFGEESIQASVYPLLDDEEVDND